MYVHEVWFCRCRKLVMSLSTEAKMLGINVCVEFLMFNHVKQGEPGLMGEMGPPGLRGLQVSDMSHTAW